MPVEPYSTIVIDGVEYWEVDVKARIAKESDPDAEVLILVATPQGGAANLGPLVKGDPGKHTIIDSAINLTALEPDDASADSASFTITTPGSDTVSQVVKLNLALHKGVPGDDGTTAIDLDSIDGDRAVGKTIVVNPENDGFAYAPPPVGGMHWPATINAATNATAGVLLGTITVASNTYLRDWRPRINASCIITGSTADVQVDLVARLGAEDGPVIGRGYGVNGTADKLVVTSGPDAGASTNVNKVTAGATATIYLRAEKQSGTATYSTAVGTTRFSIEAIQVP